MTSASRNVTFTARGAVITLRRDHARRLDPRSPPARLGACCPSRLSMRRASPGRDSDSDKAQEGAVCLFYCC